MTYVTTDRNPTSPTSTCRNSGPVHSVFGSKISSYLIETPSASDTWYIPVAAIGQRTIFISHRLTSPANAFAGAEVRQSINASSTASCGSKASASAVTWQTNNNNLRFNADYYHIPRFVLAQQAAQLVSVMDVWWPTLSELCPCARLRSRMPLFRLCVI